MQLNDRALAWPALVAYEPGMCAGLMTKVAPIIRLLDRMYAGQIVMKQYCDAYGLDWSKWHPDVFQSVQRRHEALVADVQQALTFSIPEGAFFPLGIKSQILLTGEAAVVDPEALAQVQEHAIAKAEARFAEKRRQKELALVGEGMCSPLMCMDGSHDATRMSEVDMVHLLQLNRLMVPLRASVCDSENCPV